MLQKIKLYISDIFFSMENEVKMEAKIKFTDRKTQLANAIVEKELDEVKMKGEKSRKCSPN